MKSKTIIILATHNKGKTIEIRELLRNHPVDLRNLDDFGPIPPIEEDGDSFDANAYKKASLTARYLGYPAMADDSGLMVEALNGRPGVHSARYAGENATDAERCKKLLQAMNGHENRNARFECVLSLAVPSGPALTYEGSCRGIITRQVEGESGFGYDPVFFYPPLEKTFARMSLDEKSSVSHRGKALREFSAEFEKVLKWIGRHMPESIPIGCMGKNHDR
ncbi:MAG: XTP/dITP diphosphatase [Desulfobacteraceae bacterium]|nr:XTP/dITP diphosphatase [Desulfobacteraceae bacterium]